jgi:hypothetical protein
MRPYEPLLWADPYGRVRACDLLFSGLRQRKRVVDPFREIGSPRIGAKGEAVQVSRVLTRPAG